MCSGDSLQSKQAFTLISILSWSWLIFQRKQNSCTRPNENNASTKVLIKAEDKIQNPLKIYGNFYILDKNSAHAFILHFVY